MYTKAAQTAAPDVVLSGPRCNKLVSRLLNFLVFFIGSSRLYLPSKHTKIIPDVSVMPTTQKLV